MLGAGDTEIKATLDDSDVMRKLQRMAVEGRKTQAEMNAVMGAPLVQSKVNSVGSPTSYFSPLGAEAAAIKASVIQQREQITALKNTLGTSNIVRTYMQKQTAQMNTAAKNMRSSMAPLLNLGPLGGGSGGGSGGGGRGGGSHEQEQDGKLRVFHRAVSPDSGSREEL
jgi:hypothetical protein